MAASERRVAIYARQSENVAEGIERQIARCRSLADARGWLVTETYEDNETSASKSRGLGTEWARMLSDAANGRFDVVVAVDLDRLLRDVRDLARLIDTGAAVLTVDGEIDLTTADGEFRATMLAAIARFEVRRKGERFVRANEQRASSGKPIPTRRRYGYENDGQTPRRAEAEVVRRMFAHILDGGSIRSLALALEAEGVDPAPGRQWSSRRVRDILTNPHYTGTLRYKGEVLPSEHITPIIEPERAAEVWAILSDPSRRTTTGPKPRHLGSFLTFCGECGAPLKYMREYLCSGRAAMRARGDMRPHATVRADLLEPVLVREVARALLTTPAESFGATPENFSKTRRAVADFDRLTTALDRAADDRDAGVMPQDIYERRSRRLKAERDDVAVELEALRLERASSSALAEIAHELLGDGPEWTLAEFEDVVTSVGESFTGLDIDKQREVLSALVHVEVGKGQGRDRIRVHHLIAEHLNSDADEVDAEDAGGATLIVPDRLA